MSHIAFDSSSGHDASASSELSDSGLFSLLLMAGLHGVAADAAKLRHEFGAQAFNVETILLAAKFLGMTCKAVQQDPARLGHTPLPAVAQDKQGQFFIVAKIDQGTTQSESASSTSNHHTSSPDAAKSRTRLLIQRPGEAPQILALDTFLSLWSGKMLFFASKATYAGEMAKFDFTWFIPAIVKYRKLLWEILVISLILQLIGLVTPLFFQVVMDKVLVNHALKTLHVIAIGLIGAMLFEALLTGIRTYVFAHTSSKIDVELGARLFKHLLNLPTAYFQARRVGDSVARIRELENIRSFMTGNAMTLVLDLLFSFVFLAVMLWYSRWLTLVVVASIPI